MRLLLAMALSAAASPVLKVEGGRFVDPEGRTVILRGLNVGSDAKLPPFRMNAPLDPLPGWGINALRLVFNWEAYEPSRGQYNEDYLRRLTEYADEAWRKGIYVIVDLHEDAYSRWLRPGCGEGFPSWTVPKAGRLDSPGEGACTPLWGLWMFLRPSTHAAFHHFYRNGDGARAAYLELVGWLASHFKSHPGVIGYDLINEPWGDEATELAPLYEDAAREIRKEDPAAILFLEPSAPRTSLGFLQSRLPRPSFGNFAYAPHCYDPRVMVHSRWKPSYAAREERSFDKLAAKARELSAPLFIGEFGIPGETARGLEFMRLQHALLAGRFASAAQWDYTAAWTPEKKDGWNREDASIIDDKGTLRGNFAVLPYAQKISGAPASQRVGDGDYELTWAAAEGTTEVFAPPEWAIEPPGACERKGATVVCRSTTRLRLHNTSHSNP